MRLDLTEARVQVSHFLITPFSTFTIHLFTTGLNISPQEYKH